jgi:hypothetical protein
VTVFESSKGLLNDFVEGVAHINLSQDVVRGMTKEEVNCHLLGVIMAQKFNLRNGLKKLGKEGKVAVKKELTQLHTMATYVPMDSSKMTKAQKQAALNSLIFLTEKRDGRIKSCACSDGSKERRGPEYKKEDGALPIIATESVFIMGPIDSHEGRIVACSDIPGSYLHADCSDKGEKFMLLEGHLAELMVLVEPKMYHEYVTYSPSGVPMIYERM